LNKPRSRATHTAIMLSLVTLEERFDLIWPVTSPVTQKGASKPARRRQRDTRNALRILTVLIGRASEKGIRFICGGAISKAPHAAMGTERKRC
jgi:hypothetical protein